MVYDENMKIPRFYANLDQYLELNKVLVIYGARQVGKTTLLQDYLAKTKFKYKIDSGDNIKTQQVLGSQDFKQILDYISGYELIAIDEAQRIPNVGLGLKIIVDQSPQIRVIATGSSSFEPSGQVGEPLTGRKTTLTLYPVAQIELAKLFNQYEIKENLSEYLVFGCYPSVITAKSRQKKTAILEEIINAYLLKDVLELERVKGSKILIDLLRLLAFQIGSEVSLTELGMKLGIDYKTVARYINLLEKAFVLYAISGFSRNLRKEITRKNKYYFYDNGIRNAIISNFNDLEVRDDIGKLWENFLAAERLKIQKYKDIYANNYFWRTWGQQEIDWIEERGGKIHAYEFKWGKGEAEPPSDFSKSYPKAIFKTINQKNYLDFLGIT